MSPGLNIAIEEVVLVFAHNPTQTSPSIETFAHDALVRRLQLIIVVGMLRFKLRSKISLLFYAQLQMK